MNNAKLDLADRKPIWDVLQMFWMDIDPTDELDSAVITCAKSKYSLSELEYIYWNEVYPVVSPNLNQPIPEWTGYDIEQLTELIILNQKGLKPIRLKFFNFYSNRWWKTIINGIKVCREIGT